MESKDIANYTATESLRNGRQVTIRAIKRSDTGLMADALLRVSSESLYHRTFSARKNVSGKELAWLTDVDFERIVSLVAVMQETGQEMMVGEGRYVRTEHVAPLSAEFALLVDDEHKGIGVGSIIFRHLAEIAKAAGISRFDAEVLPGNERMMRLLQRCGLPITKKTTCGTVHVTINLKPFEAK
jgi:GNAT superfamily N-acetyltransferase